MSLQTLGQQRAVYAVLEADAVQDKDKREFAQVVKGAPAQILTNGLIMTLAFWESKGDVFKRLEGVVSVWVLERFNRGNTDQLVGLRQAGQTSEWGAGDLLKGLLGKKEGQFSPPLDSLEGLQVATAETLELLNWLKRMVGRAGYEGQQTGRNHRK